MAELETTVSADSEIEREVQEEEGKASWPYATLLFFGFFGTATPEGRRLARWTAMATVGAAIGGAGLASGWPGGPGRLVWAAVLPAMMVLVAIAYVRYLAALDELARLIQLQAFAVAYAFMIVVAAGLLVYVYIAADPNVHWGLAAATIALAEVVRGAALAFFARRHE